MIEITYPTVGVNDTDGSLTWVVNDNNYVKKGTVIAQGETSKTIFDIEAPADGFIKILVPNTDEVACQTVIGIIKDSAENLENEEYEKSKESESTFLKKRWTLKAELVARELGVDITEIHGSDVSLITEDEVRAFVAKAELNHSKSVTIGNKYSKRILIIGAGHYGEVVVGILSLKFGIEIIGFVDDEKFGELDTVRNIPLLGTLKDIEKLKDANVFDEAIISIGNPKARFTIYNELKKNNISFTNAIHPNAHIEPSVSMGEGNIISASSVVSFYSSIGNNNIFSNGVVIEHHNQIGSHNLFGPGVCTSGQVIFSDGILVGANTSIEPYVSIGSNVTISSSSVICKDIKQNEIVKSRL